jgi:hypothetical protein
MIPLHPLQHPFFVSLRIPAPFPLIGRTSSLAPACSVSRRARRTPRAATVAHATVQDSMTA